MPAVAHAPDDTTVLAPQPGPQERFLASPADIAIFGGAAGGGKTYSLLLEPLRHSSVPGFRPVLFRRTYTRITQAGGMWDEASDMYGGLAAPNRTDLTWTFPSGARVKFAHLQYEDTRLDYKGAQIPLMGFDQLEEFTERQFWYLTSRNRSTCGVRPYIRATCNPVPEDDPTGGWLHGLVDWWLDDETGYPIAERSGKIRWFVRHDDDLVWSDSREELELRHPDLLPQSLTFINATLEDNPALERSDPAYRAKLMALPRVERERLLAGNWNVRPSAGDYFQRSWFRVREPDTVPNEGVTVRAWDLAASAKEREKDDPDYTVGLKVRRTPEGRFIVEHMERLRETPHRVEAAVKNMAAADGNDTIIRIPQDPGQAGKAQARHFTRQLAGYRVKTKRVTGDKTVRAGPASSQAEAENIDVVRGPWNEAFFRELERFPDGGHDDIVDALSDAIDELTQSRERVTRTVTWG